MSDEFEAWLAEATPEEATVRVVLDRRLYNEFTEAVKAYEAAKPKRAEDGQALLDEAPEEAADEAARRLVDVEQRITDAEKPFVFRAKLRRWRELQPEHPPTEQQLVREPRADINPKTFYVAMAAETCVSPGMTVEQAQELRDLLPDAKWEEITTEIQRIHVGGSSIPKSVTTTVAQLREKLNSTTPAVEESPSASSEVG